MSILNPWVLVAVLVLCVGSCVGGFYLGGKVQIARQASTAQLIVDAGKAAQTAAAAEIAKIKPRNIVQKSILEREIVKVPDYSQCFNSADGLRAINGALGNTSEPAGDSKLPGTQPAH